MILALIFGIHGKPQTVHRKGHGFLYDFILTGFGKYLIFVIYFL